MHGSAEYGPGFTEILEMIRPTSCLLNNKKNRIYMYLEMW